jgi:hypothetical protein
MKLFPSFAISQGWRVLQQKRLIVSFYGEGSGKSHPVYGRDSSVSLFPPCATRLVNDFVRYSEIVAGQWCAKRLDSQPVDSANTELSKQGLLWPEGNLFERLDRERFLETDLFEIAIDGIRIIRADEKG